MSGGSGFDERLSVPFYWYLFAAGVGALLGAEIHMGYPGLRSWIGYVTLIPLFMLAVYWLGRTRVRVTDGRLAVGKATVALHHIGRTEVVARSDKQEVLGPQLDPQAYLLHRGWIGPLVRLEIIDPDDPTPYWVFSVRRPDELLAALRR
jgi:hypothetical protein